MSLEERVSKIEERLKILDSLIQEYLNIIIELQKELVNSRNNVKSPSNILNEDNTELSNIVDTDGGFRKIRPIPIPLSSLISSTEQDPEDILEAKIRKVAEDIIKYGRSIDYIMCR